MKNRKYNFLPISLVASLLAMVLVATEAYATKAFQRIVITSPQVLPAEPNESLPITVTMQARDFSVDRITIETKADESLIVTDESVQLEKNDEGLFIYTATVTPSQAGRFYLMFTPQLYSAGGVQRSSPVGLAIQAGPRIQKAISPVPENPNEHVHAMPAQETVTTQ